jgi:putative ABC transport system permease protein
MGNTLLKNTFRQILKTRGRFFAIMAIIAIGCGFFAGVKVTSPDMKKTADKYYHDQNLMDIHLISTIGFTDEEVLELSELDNILGASGEYSADMYMKTDDGTSPVVKVYSIGTGLDENDENYINKPTLIEGRMPQSENECLIESKTPGDYKIGDVITLESSSENASGDDTLNVNSFTVVGEVSWVKYVDFERGTTTIGNGKIESYLIIPREAFKSEYYSDVYLTLKSTQELYAFGNDYTKEVDAEINTLESLSETFQTERLDDMRNQIESSRKTYEDSVSQYELAETLFGGNSILEDTAGLSDTATQLENAKNKLDEAEASVNDFKWYVLDRSYNSGYASFEDDADRVDRIARVFPVFFILVAALVCLNTMTRMVEEQRTEIGTLKALGYGNAVIMLQFLLYAVSASVIGAAVGLTIGFNLFPKVIAGAYKMMYNYPDVICEFRWDYAAGCTGAALLCTGLSAVFACYKELSGQPAQLMRPKPPKNGKRVILECLPFIWKHLSFNIKVTVRNVFRYKKRVLMTVIGIGGCTALMLTGFGLKYDISSIVDLQYGEVFKYDAVCTFSAVDDEFEQLHSDISGNTEIDEYLFAAQKSITVEASGKNIEAYAVVPEEADKIGSFISLRDRKTHSSFTLSDDGVIINEKLAKLLDVQVGDTISFENSDASAEILAITENYSGNYIYFTQNLYENVFGECKFNIFYFNKKSGTDNDSLSKSILTNSSVMSVNFMEFSGDTFRKLVKSLNSIVYVIIGSSGALAVVVLYNLSNININERMRELATIKVLGFYDSETAAYIYRENVVSSVIGMLLGLFGGVFLTRFVVQTAEVDVVMFCPDIPLHCYIYAAGLTIVFTTLVNGLLHFKIKKIDMASSMKAIE